MTEPARNKVNISPSTMVKNEASIIKMESSSPEAKHSSSNQQTDSDYGTSLSDNSLSKVKVEVQDDAPCSKEEGSVRPGCSSYTATIMKQELDIGPTELQSPDMNFMPQPCKPDPDFNIPLQDIEDFPQGQELPVLKREEFTQQPGDDLFLQNSSGSLPQGKCGPMSQQDAQRVEIVLQPADADASDDAPCSKDEGSVRPGCSSYTATIMKQELDIGPTELQPPDMNFMPQTCCKPDPDFNIPLQDIEDFPQGQELRVLKREEFTQQPGDDLFLQNSSGSLPQGKCGPMSQQDGQRVEIVLQPADADASEYINPIFVEFPSPTSEVPVMIVPQDSTHLEDLCSVTCNSHETNVCNTMPSLKLESAHCKVLICKSSLLSHKRDHKHKSSLQNITHDSQKNKVAHVNSTFECDFCDKIFLLKSQLILHMNVHICVLAYKGKSCNKNFIRRSHLSRHMCAYIGEKPFGSETCCKKFAFSLTSSEHMRLHTGEKPLECISRVKKFAFNSSLLGRMRFHAGEKSFECKSCDKKFTRKTHLIRHMRMHTGEKPFECKSCDKKLTRKAHLISHMQMHTDEKPFECESCDKKFTRKGNLIRHMRIHTGEKPFECLSCVKKFGQRSLLNRHMRTHTGEKPFECDSCDKKFAQKGNLISHMHIHTGKKPFECKSCDRKFTEKGNLISHMRLHTSEKPIKCKTCYKKFRTNSELSIHMKLHSGENRFECDYCNNKFTRKAHLIRHIRLHTGEKPFECVTCYKKFTQRATLIRHTRLHTGEKPFDCETCCKKFTQNANLIRHMQTHTDEKPFECETCCKKFRHNTTLINHMLSHTGEKPFEYKTCYKK